MRAREMPAAKCLYFGCWNEAGHYLWAPGKSSFWNDMVSQPGGVHIDGTLAPRKVTPNTRTWNDRKEDMVWQAMGTTREDRSRIDYDSSEYPQGQFLLHVLPNGFTAIQWWDRCQGDTRGACNSTILLSGVHTAEEVLTAGRQHFPHVFANLEKAGVKLVDVTRYHEPEKKTCVTEDHTCVEGTKTTSADDCKGCEAVEMLKSLP